MARFTDRDDSNKTFEVVLNGHPDWCKPEDNEAYFLFSHKASDFQLPVEDIPALVKELQRLYDEAQSHTPEEDVPAKVEPVKDEDVMERYIEALNRHSEALDENSHQMSVFPTSSLDALTEAIKALPTINDLDGPNRW